MHVVDTPMAVSSSLPPDPLLEIFLRLEEPTDVIRCAAVCKPWRRIIIGNAARFRRPRFDPRLLLGVFHSGECEARLWRTRGLFQSALPSSGVGGYETAGSLIPDASAGGGFIFDRGLYRELLWSADGFILLMARTVNRLCLFNPMTRDCTFLPTAASKCSAYILLTGYDVAAASSPPGGSGNRNKLAARILEVQKRDRFMFGKEEEGGLLYQVLFASGAGDSAAMWGPVQRSGGGDESEVREAEQSGLCMCMERRTTLVCRGTVYWLAGPREGSITCTLALDVSTGRTWTTELPLHHRRLEAYPASYPPILATSGDGRLSLIESPLLGPRIHVWVTLNDGNVAWWTLQQTISFDVSDLSLSAFCPRSGCVVAVCSSGREFLIDIHSGMALRVLRRIGERRGHYDCHPYEMDCSSTYISKMKQF